MDTTKLLPQEEWARHSIAALPERVVDIYPAFLRPSLVAGKTPPASIHSLQILQPALRLRPDYAASALLPISS